MQHDPSGQDAGNPSTRPAGDAPASPAPRRHRRRGLTAGLTVALVGGGLVAASVAQVGPFGPATTAGPGDPEPDRTQAVAYSTFQDCSALLGYLKKHGRDLVGPYGLPGSGGFFGGPAVLRSAAESVGGAADSAAGPAPVAAAAPNATAKGADGTTSATGTNVQVSGVDEADLAKRVGDLVYSAAPSEPVQAKDPDGTRAPALTVARTSGGRSSLVGRLTLEGWQPTSLLVEGDRVLLVGYDPGAGAVPLPARVGAVEDRILPGWWVQRTRLVEVDVADPANPRVLRTLTVDGSSVGVRLVDGVARVAVSGATYRLRFKDPITQKVGADTAVGSDVVVPPMDEGQLRKAERDATAANRRVVERSGVEDWLPRYDLSEGAASGPTTSGRLLSCSDVSAPTTFSGLDTLSLLTFDLRDPAGISRWDGAGVVASGAQLYATADRTYVATNPWQDWTALAAKSAAEAQRAMRSQRTQIHLFDTAGGASPVYVASGSVKGFLLNQFSMDEHEGYLRVASTSAPSWWGGDVEQDPSVSRVTVLEVGDDALDVVGSVGGLGKTETIRSVRFLGDVGYVVTFRQTDPLYTIDLSDPAQPRVAGELKILGYSAYLHPVGDGLLMGVGQDADKEGRTTGLQLSLFDVSDPANPRRVDQVTLPGAWSDVEGDHHAFTFADGLALVPYAQWQDLTAEQTVEGEDAGGSSGSTGSTDPAAPVDVLPVQTYDAGVVAVRLDAGGAGLSDPVVLRPVGDGPQRIDQTKEFTLVPTPLRTFVGDGSVWTVTSGGIAAHDAATLQRTDFAAF